MVNESLSKQVNKPEASATKLLYRQPKVTVFGKLHRLALGSHVGNNDASGFPKNTGSDRRIKENIVRLDSYVPGVDLYLFGYKKDYRDAWGHGRQFGVMADEVERVLPQAVSMHAAGYKLVDYTMLGIERA